MIAQLRMQAIRKMAQQAGFSPGIMQNAQKQPEVGINPVAKSLHTAFNNPDLEAAILANINRETGGTFDYRTWQGFKKQPLDLTHRQTGGYGLFQLTGRNLQDYKAWLTKRKLNDSANNQISFVRTQYGPGRLGWKKNTAPSSGMTREQLADWWHRRVETPAHVLKGSRYYSPTRIQQATRGHNDFMKNRIRNVNGVWQEVSGRPVQG